MRYVAFALAAMLATASMAKASEMTYAECQSHCLKHNQPMPVAVGKCEYTGDVVRADWLKDEGYPNNAVLWFAPAEGKLWYSGTTKPTLVNGSYFPPTASPTASACSGGSCSTSSAPVRLRLLQGVQSGSCAGGSCGR